MNYEMTRYKQLKCN